MSIRNVHYLVYVSAFLVPIVLLSIIFAVIGVYPFGNYTALTVDLYHQYIHYYSYFTDAVKGKESLLYSWHEGLGSNFIGDIAYYTSSPLLFILFFFPKEYFPEAALLIILVKIGLCGLTAGFYIRKKFMAVKPYEVVIFSSFYALMSYTVTYFYNVMWLDGVILLPLLILSVDAISKNKSFIPYTCFLTLLIIANFYIAYMVGLFIFLYFLIDYFFKPNKKSILTKFLSGTFIAIGISAFLTVPTFFQLLGTLGGSTGQTDLYTITFNFFFKLYSGVYDSGINGAPNIYIGSFVLLLVPAFFIGKHSRYEKIKWGSLLLILAVSSVIPALNLLWHAGDIPNWFPFRYSFLVSFILLHMSLTAYEKVETTKFKVFLILFAANFLILSITFITKAGRFNVVNNLLFLMLFLIVLYMKKSGFKKIEFTAFLILMLTELLFNSSMTIAHVYKEFGGVSRSDYTIYTKYASAAAQIKKLDPAPFYRVETDLNKTDNDSLTLGTGSLSHSSSMLSKSLINTMHSFGFSTGSVNYRAKGSTVLTSSILGQKYFVSSLKPADANYKQVSKNDSLTIYKNTSYLPIGFPAEQDVSKINPAVFKNPFLLQNKVFQTVFKTNSTLFKSASPEKVEYGNVTIKKGKDELRLVRQNKNSPIKITYFFTSSQSSANLYALFSLKNNKKAIAERQVITVFINNINHGNYFPSQFNGILKLGESVKSIEVDIRRDTVAFGRDTQFYREDTNEFQKDVDSIDRHAFTITQIKGNHLHAKGTVSGDHQLLFLSIPWDEGWRVNVNGKKVMPIKVLGDFMGIPLTKGSYDLQMTFMPKGFLAGSFISLVSLVIFLAVIFRRRKRACSREDLR